MSNIKVFVSHRIDVDSVKLENSIYVPVRCGASFDKNPEPTIIGDNTGMSISDKRDFLGEFTVQYWAWKNVEADYYGICHYRRYLSFSEKKFPTNENNQVIEDYLSDCSFEKFGLNNEKHINAVVSDYDAVVAEYADISKMYTPRGCRPTVYKHFAAYNRYLVNKEDIDLFLETLERLYPKYGKSAQEYFAGSKFRGYNCFILKKDLFFELCQMEIDILEAILETKKIDFEFRSTLQQRSYGFFCEWMFGVFIYHLEKEKRCRIKTTQLVFFRKTECPQYIEPIENHLPVVFLTNQYLLPVTQVAIQSLLQKKDSNTKYDIIICHEELTDLMKNNTAQFFEKNKDVSVRFVNFRDLTPEASNGTRWNRRDNSEHAIYLLPWILKNFRRIIFLHSDLLIMTDLNELYTASLCGNYLAAPRDYYRICENGVSEEVEKIRKYKLNLENPWDYFSTAVLVMDLAEIRQNMTFDLCLRYTMGNYYCRDVMNKLFGGKVKVLDACWNVCAKANESLNQMEGFMPKVYADELKSAKKNPFVLHFVLSPKPWQNPFNEWAPAFWKTARSVPLYEQLLIRYWEVLGSTQAYGGLPPTVQESLPRRVSNVLLPKGSMRRELLKKVLPKNSNAWNCLKRIYYKFIHHQ